MSYIIINNKFPAKYRRKKIKLNIMDLPEEIWLLIFKNLDAVELQKLVKRVCHDWCRVIEDASLYTRIVIDYRLTGKDVTYLLRKYRTSIRHIQFLHDPEISSSLNLISNCVNLRTLKLDSCHKCPGITYIFQREKDQITAYI